MPNSSDSKHTNKLLEAILQGIGTGVAVFNRHGDCLLMNPIAKNLLGIRNFELNEQLQSSPCNFFEDDCVTELPEEKRPISLTVSGATVNNQEMFYRNEESGASGWCNITTRPLTVDEVGAEGGILIIEEISERKRLSDEVARSNRELQQFAYVAAHDLQEPIRSIVGFGELLQSRIESFDDAKAQDQLKRVLAAAGRMQNLVAALLSYARIETQAKPSAMCDCNKMLQDILADKASLLSETNAEVIVEKLPTVMADYSQLSQVFSNLIGNAIKYRSESRRPQITVSAVQERRQNHFIVKDNGIGMEMQFSTRIFIIFQRLHNKSAYEGVGIGLALCKKIIENHGGKIWVHSEPNVGTEMHFTLPKIVKELNRA